MTFLLRGVPLLSYMFVHRAILPCIHAWYLLMLFPFPKLAFLQEDEQHAYQKKKKFVET